MPTRAVEPAVCSGCKPPLVYAAGGRVMSTNTGGGLTVTPIYWEPSGGQYKFPAGYESIIDGFVADVAAASGSSDNVFSIPTEYYQNVGGAKTSISYKIRAGSSLVATDPFPSSGCKPVSGYRACLTDAQLQTELGAVTSSQPLPKGLAYFYPMFFPPGVETVDSDGTTSIGGFCGYHKAFGSSGNETVYANMPYEATGCDGGRRRTETS